MPAPQHTRKDFFSYPYKAEINNEIAIVESYRALKASKSGDIDAIRTIYQLGAERETGRIVDKPQEENVLDEIKSIAETLGIDPSALHRFTDVLKAGYKPIDAGVRSFSKDEFIELVEDRLGRALMFLDDTTLVNAKAHELAKIVSMLVDKRALLRGEPTKIVSNTMDRDKMMGLLRGLMIEANRRGIDVSAMTSKLVDITPRPVELVSKSS